MDMTLYLLIGAFLGLVVGLIRTKGNLAEGLNEPVVGIAGALAAGYPYCMIAGPSFRTGEGVLLSVVGAVVFLLLSRMLQHPRSGRFRP